MFLMISWCRFYDKTPHTTVLDDNQHKWTHHLGVLLHGGALQCFCSSPIWPTFSIVWTSAQQQHIPAHWCTLGEQEVPQCHEDASRDEVKTQGGRVFFDTWNKAKQCIQHQWTLTHLANRVIEPSVHWSMRAISCMWADNKQTLIALTHSFTSSNMLTFTCFQQ